MSGGQRGERKRKQQQRQGSGQGQAGARKAAAKSVSSARSAKNSRNQVFMGIAVVVVLAVAVIGGVIYTNSQSEAQQDAVGQLRTELQIADGGIPATEVSPEKLAPRITDAGVVEAGNPDAKVTVSIYEDFICPYCGELFKQSNKELEQAVDKGQIKLQYHLVNFLDEGSEPAGYSSRAANAAMCTVDSGAFRPFYEKLFSQQPPEGGPGYTNEQLTRFGDEAGAGKGFASCVEQGRYDDAVNKASAAAQQRLAETSPSGQVGTPTVLVAGRQLQALGKPEWLRELIGAA